MENFEKNLQEIDGIKYPIFFPEKHIREAFNYQPRSDDIFIASYPKSGSHWTQYIIQLLFNKGEPCKSYEDFKKCSLFIDLEGVNKADNLNNPRMLATHFPYDKCPKNEITKYIFVLRNPKDVIVSYYYFLTGIIKDPLDLDSTFDLFLEGKLMYGDYFKYTKTWYEHRDDPNILILTYEEMKEELEKSIMKIAKFLNMEEALKENPEIVEKVIKNCSVEETKKVLKTDTSNISKEKGEAPIPEVLKEKSNITIVRKGIVGDWKTHLTREQEERLNQRAEKELAGIDFYEYWKKLGIFQLSQ
ncbi:hypothetical protein LAZ67_6001690 [Cordylochernes scorpioides]|uniref:Sulfotransferase domain-containing protein n=1 Tax=Cordylochernes scorpioides TaxID=51811 RepID=A0ABY6KJB6_9ARAC|nr:hypothetical protein LAZ67_6001690 [Cordylochernes scorpioides]